MFGAVVEAIAEVLLSDQGSIVLAILAVLMIAAPLADRYVIRRKRLAYRVQYNSKIGLSHVDLSDPHNPAQHDELRKIGTLLDTMSVVVIRIRNTGVHDIDANDFDPPLTFGFGGRIIWDARISEPSIDTHRDGLKRGLQFLPDHEPPESPQQGDDTLAQVRLSLRQRILKTFRGNQNGEQNQAPAGEPLASAPQWDTIRLTGLHLERKEKFKLVVVLKEPDGPGDADKSEDTDDAADGESTLTKKITPAGHITGGRVVDEREQRPITWRRVMVTIGVLLTGALLATLIAVASNDDATALSCADGELNVVGSSAFAPAFEDIGTDYEEACDGTEITVAATGSNAGVRELANATEDEAGSLAALSDGESDAATPELVAHPLGVIMYAVVVNESAGAERLTVEQVRGIYAGRYTDWNQVREGPSMPIRIVGRGQESGSRSTFEATVLDGASAGELSSNSCVSRDRNASAPTIRCERGRESLVLDEIASTDGAIGYVDLPSANEARTAGRPLSILRLDQNYPDVTNIENGYPFWAIEYLYTRGEPAEGSVQRGLLESLREGTARAALQDAGYTPCVTGNGSLHHHCR